MKVTNNGDRNGDFSLGEAKRQINSLWSAVDSVKIEIKQLTKEFTEDNARTREKISELVIKVESLLDVSEKLISGRALPPKLIETDMMVTELAKDVHQNQKDIRELQGKNHYEGCPLNQVVNELKATVKELRTDNYKAQSTIKILKWILYIISAILIGVAGKLGYDILTVLINLIGT